MKALTMWHYYKGTTVIALASSEKALLEICKVWRTKMDRMPYPDSYYFEIVGVD